MQLDIHLVAIQRTVGRVLQHRFLEIEIPSVPQHGSDPLALLIQHLGRELFARVDLTAVIHSDDPYGILRDVHRVAADIIGLMSCHQISDIYLTVLDRLECIHFGLEITHVIHLLLELLHADAGEVLIVDHRRFAHLMRITRQTLLRLGSRVRRGGVIDMELQFPETQDLGVLMLTQILVQFTGRDRFVVHTLHPRLIQEVLPLRHEFRRVARCQKQQQNE